MYDAAGAAGYQLLAPREHPEAGLGHHYQSPYRLQCIELMRSRFGQGIFRLRGDIERECGVLTSFGGGLTPLAAWVRHQNRAWIWTAAKLVVNAVRIVRHKRLAASMQFPLKCRPPSPRDGIFYATAVFCSQKYMLACRLIAHEPARI